MLFIIFFFFFFHCMLLMKIYEQNTYDVMKKKKKRSFIINFNVILTLDGDKFIQQGHISAKTVKEKQIRNKQRFQTKTRNFRDCSDQTARMRMLIWTYVVSKLYESLYRALRISNVCSARGGILYTLYKFPVDFTVNIGNWLPTPLPYIFTGWQSLREGRRSRTFAEVTS